MKKVLAVSLLLLAVFVPSASAGGITWSGYNWSVHNGVSGSGQCQSPNHVSIQNGHLFEQISGNCGGGIGMKLEKHLGTWSATYRMTPGAGKYNFLLWRSSGNHRPEVDFSEEKRGDSARQMVTGTYHPLPGCTNCTHAKLMGDFTQWHTTTVKWTSAGFALYMDGNQWAFFPSNYGGTLHLAIQVAPWGDSGTSTLEVSNVTVS